MRSPDPGVDLRMVLPAAGAWAVAAVAVGVPPSWSFAASGLAATIGALGLRARCPMVALVAFVVAGSALAGGLRSAAVGSGLLADLAAESATAQVRLRVVTDPREVETAHDTLVVLDATVTRIEARGVVAELRAPVVVWADPELAALRLGETVMAAGRLRPSDDRAHAASFTVRSVTDDPVRAAWWWRGSDRLRSTVTQAVDGRGAEVRGLLPALVHGDDHAVSPQVEEDFRESGLTHLLAVSGTNLTLVVGFLLVLLRPFRPGPRTQVVVGLLGTLGFVLLARPEPSVVRAAVMGTVALLGLGLGGRGRGVRCLSWAVVVIVLTDPWMARSVGFLLSAGATAGILLLAPPWRDALARWMPRWVAEALAVPMAAQLVCTPVIAAISGSVSVVAVLANVVAAPAVGPATVLGLGAGLVGLAWPWGAQGVGRGAAAFVWWIIEVAHRCADLPGAAIAWGGGVGPVLLLTTVCLGTAVGVGRALARPSLCLLLVCAVGVYLVRPVTPGWPPAGWVMVACDVGQGDASVIRAGPGTAVVVDAGPDPRLVDRCLDRLGVVRVAALVLTHDHADHVDGLRGVVQGRETSEIEVGTAGGADGAAIAVRTVVPGESRTVGEATWTVLWPPDGRPVEDTSTPEGGSALNDASVVLLVRVRGLDLLLTGDVEPPTQRALMERYPDLHADVLKIPHHGSARQEAEFLTGLGAAVATVSAGADNTFGHPAPATLDVLRRVGVTVGRTDLHGDVAVVEGEDGPILVTSQANGGQR